jgi:serine/threonine protein phosphatase PrpC
MSKDFSLQFCSRSHTGKVKRNNEDYLRIHQNRFLAAIADGMGGTDFGEVASQIAVDASIEYLANTTSTKLLKKPAGELGNAVKYANEAIIAIQRNQEKYRTMGSTLTCFLMINNQLHFSWVGDSRIYIVRPENTSIQMLTKDHTLDRNKIDATLAPDLYRRAPSILTQKVGSILLIQPDTGCFELKAGDIILACSDGLSDRIDDQLLLEYGLTFAGNLEGYADKLLDRALDCGGQDNISLILAQVMR